MKIALLLLLASASALADDASLLRCRTISDGVQRLACYDAMVVGAKPAAAAQTMGQSYIKPKATEPKSFTSTIPGKFDGISPNKQITLANGEVWRIVDDSRDDQVVGTDLKVTVERNFVGTTFMVIEGTNTAPKVRRVQ
ncbi:MAG: hypothetical protein V4857_00930 [Pseudomonadota bacterium]